MPYFLNCPSEKAFTNSLAWIVVFLVLFSSTSCVTIPPDLFILSPNSLEKRELETRQYETTDEEKIISSSAGVLQDLGFNIDESEKKLGLIVASKDRDATNAGQVTIAVVAMLAAAAVGTYSDAYYETDKSQKMRASVVTKLSADGKKMLVRVTFQRIVWNVRGQVSKMETLSDVNLYQGFFERLSKSIFLEEHEI